MPSYHTTLEFDSVGQLLESYPPTGEVRASGPPSSATYAIYSGSQSLQDDPEVGPTSATLDATNTTLDAASGVSQTNRKRINLTATTSVVVGRRYLVTNALGQREVVTVASISSGNYVDVEEQLVYDYASSDTFKGLHLSFVIDADLIADEESINEHGDPYRVLWSYTVNSLPCSHWTSFDIHRTPAKSLLGIEDLREVIPDIHLGEFADQRGQDFQPQLRAAQRELQIDVRAAGYDPDDMQDPQLYQSLLLSKWAVVVAKGYQFTDPTKQGWIDQLVKDYTNTFDKTVNITFKAWATASPTAEIIPSSDNSSLWLSPR
jgi:hypothetical protein